MCVGGGLGVKRKNRADNLYQNRESRHPKRSKSQSGYARKCVARVDDSSSLFQSIHHPDAPFFLQAPTPLSYNAPLPPPLAPVPEIDADREDAECKSIPPDEAERGGAGGGARGAVVWLYRVTWRSTPLLNRSEVMRPVRGAKGDCR